MIKKFTLFAAMLAVAFSFASCNRTESRHAEDRHHHHHHHHDMDDDDDFDDDFDDDDEFEIKDKKQKKEPKQVTENKVAKIETVEVKKTDKPKTEEKKGEKKETKQSAKTQQTAKNNSNTKGAAKYDSMMDEFDSKAFKLQKALQQGKKQEASDIDLELSMLGYHISENLDKMSSAQQKRFAKQMESFQMLKKSYK